MSALDRYIVMILDLESLNFCEFFRRFGTESYNLCFQINKYE